MILHFRNLLHRKLLARLTIPMIIAAAFLGVVIIDAVLFIAIPEITYAWILVGIAIGYPFGRLTKRSWNSERTQVVLVGSQLTLLVIFIAIRIITSIIIRMEFAYLSYALDITFLVGVGGFIGREIGMLRQIQIAMASTNNGKTSLSLI